MPVTFEYDGKWTVTAKTDRGDFSFRTDPEAARLIAAASDLLAALQTADFILTAVKGSEADLGVDMYADIDRDLAVIGAAIARATASPKPE